MAVLLSSCSACPARSSDCWLLAVGQLHPSSSPWRTIHPTRYALLLLLLLLLLMFIACCRHLGTLLMLLLLLSLWCRGFASTSSPSRGDRIPCRQLLMAAASCCWPWQTLLLAGLVYAAVLNNSTHNNSRHLCGCLRIS
jgi:energy-coupling factor transporter transmembrane protein EcfT